MPQYEDTDMAVTLHGPSVAALGSSSGQASDTPTASSHPPPLQHYHRSVTDSPSSSTSGFPPPPLLRSTSSVADSPVSTSPSTVAYATDHADATRVSRSSTLSSATTAPPSSFSGHPIKRKPLSATASHIAVRYSSGQHPSIISASLDRRSSRSHSLAGSSPRMSTESSTAALSKLTGQLDSSRTPPSSAGWAHTASPVSLARNTLTALPAAPQTDRRSVLQHDENVLTETRQHTTAGLSPTAEEDVPDYHRGSIIENLLDESDGSVYSLNTNNNSADAPARSTQIYPPPLTFPPALQRSHTEKTISAHRQFEDDSAPTSPTSLPQRSNTIGLPPAAAAATRLASSSSTPTLTHPLSPPPQLNKPLPKSPVLAKFGTFFSWASSPSVSEFSSIPSPISPRHTPGTDAPPIFAPIPHPRNGSVVYAAGHGTDNPLGYCEGYLQTPPAIASPSPPGQIEEMEEELKAISAELAASIRREMDLEDLVDRLQADIPNHQAPGKRTSDYYSDSGASSAKFSEYDQTREELERIQRRAEQEKAQLRLELTTKLQDERATRRSLDNQIRVLSEKVSQIDLARLNSIDATSRAKDLENTCEDLRRRLSEERRVKDNFEDLLKALKGELQTAANERDNLRDEIVPGLRARVEGLESQAADFTNMTYESTKIQQELQLLRKENEMLRTAKPQGDAISTTTLSRSASVNTPPFILQRPPTSLKPSPSPPSAAHPLPETKEGLSDRLKDVEAQRDALHNALKNLLERQEFQNRENEKKIRALETERDRLLVASPGKAGYERDLGSLRNEIQVLRRRAEDALEHKWQVEKGLIGLKTDLDRTEEEVESLRALLKEKDILIPESLHRASTTRSSSGTPVSSESLSRAYRELQDSYQDSLERLRKLEADGSALMNDKAQLAMRRLEEAVSSVTTERDVARRDADSLKNQLDKVAGAESGHLETERALADELGHSARRVEELAAQVQQQLATNANLRQRLVDTVAQRDAERKVNAERVTSLETRLKTLEEQLISSQTASEEKIARHEEELAALREVQSHPLRRISSSPAAGGFLTPPKSVLTPMQSPLLPRTPRTPRSPRFALPKTLAEDVEIGSLRDRVAELERSLADAENEMQSVVGKMSATQIEVINLQEEREAAARETRRLQKMLDDERVKSFEDRFRTLSSNVV